MTSPFPLASWHDHAADLADLVTPPGSRWRKAVLSTPRHLLVPRWWGESGQLVDGPADPDRWLTAAYGNTTLVTRLAASHADHATPGDRPEWRPTSSSTLPSLVVDMLRHTRIQAGMDILDVGTGSGYSSALLCHRLGSDHVTSIDVDPYLVDAARERLAGLGHHPRLVTADATEHVPGTYDRIVAMVAMPHVPPTWLVALRPGGRLVLTLTGTTLIITAHKTEDGGAAGRVVRDWAGFMHARRGPLLPPRLIDHLPEPHTAEGDTVTRGRYPVLDIAAAWDIASLVALSVPGIETGYQEQRGRRTAWLVHPDGSWARAAADGMNAPTVHQSGPRRLWDELDAIREQLVTAGSVWLYDAAVTISPEGTVRLDHGDWSACVRAETSTAGERP